MLMAMELKIDFKEVQEQRYRGTEDTVNCLSMEIW